MALEHESRSARFVALLRALHQTLPEERRIHSDPFATSLIVGDFGRRIVRSRFLSRCVETIRPGAAAQIAARDHFADRWAKRTWNGPSQVLLVGAGFDSMTLRLLPDFPETVFFEIDLPATQQKKLALLAERNLLPPPECCRFVASNFEQNELRRQLPAAGFDSALPTFANWMGVSYYLPVTAIHQMLETFRELLPHGSVVAMDYTGADAFRKPTPWRAMLEYLGETIKTRFNNDELTSLAEKHGFEVAELTTAAKIAGDHLHQRRRPRLPMRLAALRKRT